MTGALEWLLDLENIRLGRDAPVALQWEHTLPAWAVFTIALAGLGFIALVYRHESTSQTRRVVLGLLRVALFGLVLAVLCKPVLVLQRNRIEPSFVAVLVDTSASMATRDAPSTYGEPGASTAAPQQERSDDAPDATEPTRLEQLQAALSRNDAAPIRTLLSTNGVELLGFAGSVEPLAFAGGESRLSAPAGGVRRPAAASTADDAPAVRSVTDALLQLRPDGFATDIAGAVARVLERSEGRRLAAVVVASDGRVTSGPDLRDATEMAASRQVPIYAVPIGSEIPPVDVEIGPLRAARTVFLHDMITVETPVAHNGITAETVIELRLLDLTARPGGEVVAREAVTLVPGTETQTVELHTKPARTGTVSYRVEATPLPRERIVDNNADQIEVNVTDDRVRVLYVEAYPRYEYRYLKNAFLRERSMDVSVLLLEADESFVQEGTIPIRRFPETPEELNRYDVVLFGDVDPRAGWLSQAQMLMMLDFVANEGGGFGLVAGERSAPHRFLGTPLERLIPVVIDPAAGTRGGSPNLAFSVQPTTDGYNSRLFRFAPTMDENRRVIDSLPPLYWIAKTLGPKPGATVLAEHPTLSNPRGPGGMPLIVVGQYGAGKIYFQAVDGTWRWRRHTGELLHDSFWVHVARELMRPARMLHERKLVLYTDRRTYRFGTAVHVQAEVFDAQLLRDRPESFDVGLYRQGGPGTLGPDATGAGSGEPDGSGRSAHAGFEPQTLVTRFPLTRLAPGSNHRRSRLEAGVARYEGSVVPPNPGRFSLEPMELSWASGAASPAGGGSVRVRVERPSLEARRPAADHQTLERIARATGGRILDPNRLAEGFAAIPDRSLQVPDDVVEPLWDTKLIFGLFTLMICLEWGLRKAFGLL